MKKIILLFMLLTSVSFAWSFDKNKGGKLTGYSTPISQDVYKQLGIDPYNDYQRLKSPNVMTDLFSTPQINYDNNSNNTAKYNGTGGISSKCGVTIIYD